VTIELPTTPGSVVRSDSLLILSRFGNWVSDGVFAVSADDLMTDGFTVIFDAGSQAGTTPQHLGMALCAIQNPDDPRQVWEGMGHEFVADAEKLLALFEVRAK